MKAAYRQKQQAKIMSYDEPLYPRYHETANSHQVDYPWMKLLCFGLGVSILLCFILLWYVYVVASLLSVCLCILIMRHEGSKKSTKLFWILCDIIGMLVLIDLGDGQLNWSIDYVIPLLLILTIGTVMIVMLIRHRWWERYIGIQIYSIIIAIALNILLLMNVSHILWPSITALGLGLSTLALMAMVFGRAYARTLEKFLHL